jgi:hypothetical protein
VPYKGPIPQLPAPSDRPRRIAGAAEIQAILTPRERAQQPLVEAGDRIRLLAEERRCGGLASIALEDDPPSVAVSWTGSLPQPVRYLVDELRRTVRVVVRAAPQSLDELLAEAQRIIAVG